MKLEPGIPPILSERLELRGFQPSDLPGYVAYYTGKRTTGVGGPLQPHQAFERFCAMIGHWSVRGFGRYAIADRFGGPAFGHVGPMQLDAHSDPEMTWTIWDEAKTGRGLATEAAQAVLDNLYAKGWTRLLAYIDRDNAASLRMAKRLGAVEDPTIPVPDFLSNTRRFVLRPKVAA